MSDVEPLTKRQRICDFLSTLVWLAMAVNFTAGWARYLMGDDVALPWWVYFVGAIGSFWCAFRCVKRSK